MDIDINGYNPAIEKHVSESHGCFTCPNLQEEPAFIRAICEAKRLGRNVATLDDLD